MQVLQKHHPEVIRFGNILAHNRRVTEKRAPGGLMAAHASASGIVDKCAVKQNWQARGFSFGVFRDPPGQVWPDFTHATDELVVLCEGEMVLEFGGKTIRPEVGEEVLIPAKVLHTVINPSPTRGSEWLYGYAKK